MSYSQRIIQPLVAVSTDVREFEKYTWHATPEQYLEAAVSVAGVLPLLLPSFADRLNFDWLLSSVDGVLLTGSKSNVHPGLYGGVADEKSGPYDERRDATTIPLIRKAIEKGIPLLAICRGIQELNVALSGTLANDIQERDGIMDHRAPQSDSQDERFAIRHPVTINPGTCLADILGTSEISVNSVHRQAVERLSPKLQVEATAPDGTVEAVSVKGARGFALGVQWHPEYWAATDSPSQRLFAAFGDAVRAHAETRLAGARAQESGRNNGEPYFAVSATSGATGRKDS
ncbi:gamma-glutamyl-gamma-aminobutyrate hydrolase family protein [Chelativorans sp. Marseille-P2723]|uniref:gamma-glutamyl-gamma-aminobutyrate hydrolase family protein n=1 Tax=Chelativorans sp. Marseille-P2723 TaxID=2709133 RepID=UPI001FF0106B|nr:gamma-glutamyl-gamma-aminobutyrate hydrolase family protein [Chelativorans sp. Marseille-P2723]